MYDTIYKEIEVRQKFDEELKAKVALEVLKEEKTLQELAQHTFEMYQHFGFKVMGKLFHPVIKIPQWDMLRG
ncbi:hypothetical protein [Marispirochaeta aestuarii]|uniref:hypothetical protein n=1 Tax=Marispirochaeta aestuarii TaxID=1963862 RepID=UPI0029C6A4C4|nr:hypothetical protein [Marispirochaeta aestuarii]